MTNPIDDLFARAAREDDALEDLSEAIGRLNDARAAKLELAKASADELRAAVRRRNGIAGGGAA